MVAASSHGRLHADDNALGPHPSEPRLPCAKMLEIGLALRPAHSGDGDALQSYMRGLSPHSRYNRFLGAASELPASIGRLDLRQHNLPMMISGSRLERIRNDRTIGMRRARRPPGAYRQSPETDL